MSEKVLNVLKIFLKYYVRRYKQILIAHLAFLPRSKILATALKTNNFKILICILLYS